MKDQLISFKTAMLAQEKGFEGKCFYSYIGNDIHAQEPIKGEEIKNNIFNQYLAPTQSLLQKWLRKEHDIHIEVLISSHIMFTYYTTIHQYQISIDQLGVVCDTEECPTYEEAFEGGLKEALKLI